MTTLQDRMADLRPEIVGHADVSRFGWPERTSGQPEAAARRPDGQARDLTDAEAAAGLDPQGMRHELEISADRVLAQWAPVLAGQRAELADQVTAAVDDGRLDQLAALAAPAGPAAELLYRAMAAVAAKSAGRMIAEAAGQGIDIDPAAVRVDHGRLRQLAQARAAMAAGQLAQAASRRALQVVTASAGTDAAREVLTVLHQLSTRPLADQLMAALHTAANEARLAVLDAGPEGVYTATEINDANTCGPCAEIDGHVFAGLDDARAHYANGAYVHCAGELRCRGTVVASWPHTPFHLRVPGAAAAPDAEAAEWREGLHRRDRRGRFARKTGPAPGGPPGKPASPARPPGRQAGLPWTADGGVAAYHGSLGIDRADMPQLSGNDVHGTYRPSAEIRPRFVRYLEDRGIKVTSERVPAETLKPTQATGDTKAIRGIAADLRSGKLKDTKTIFVSADGRVLDGHHNWAGRMLADAEGGRRGLEPGMPVIRVDLPAGELLGAALAFGEREGIARRKTGEHQHPAFRAPAPAGPPQPRDTLERYTRPDGTWDPARERLHQDIIRRVLGGHPRQAEPVAMFFGGGPASGKSSLTGPADSARIDPDEIKGMLPEYQDMLAAQDPGAAAYTHEESSHIAKEAVAQARSSRIHYILDGTGDSQYQKLAGKVNEARAAGYRVHARYVTADTDEAIRRATERAKRTGRMVPAPVIREIHAAVSDAFARAAREGLFDSAELYDTNGASPRLIAHGTGREFTVDDPAAWQRFLDKGTGSTG